MINKIVKPLNIFYELWFPKNTQSITIVASPEYEDLKDAKLTSPNYALLDRLGDRDSIFSIGKLLSRKYPKASIDLISSEDFYRQSLQKNFVIIGGPGGWQFNDETQSKNEFEGNEACRVFSKLINSNVSYTDDCEILKINNIDFVSEYDTKAYMTVDYGYFAAFKNPILQSTRVIMIHGIHTLGVLGATRVFDGEVDSENNFKTIMDLFLDEEINTKYSFESILKVRVTKGEVSCPELHRDNIILLTKPISSASNTKNIKPYIKESEVEKNNRLKAEILLLLKIAEQNATIDYKRRTLCSLIKKMESLSSTVKVDYERIMEICNRNTSFPEENLKEINKAFIND